MKKRFFRFFLVFFFAMMLAGCTFLADGTNKQREAAKNHVKTLLAVNYGDTIDDRVLEPVTQSFGIVIDESNLATEEDLANASYSGFLNGSVFARFESSNPEIMEPKWVSYKTRAYEKDASGKITGITVTEKRELRVIVNRPEVDTVVKLTTYATAPYEINGVTYKYEAKRTIEFTVAAAEQVEETIKTIGEINAEVIANWSAFESAGKLVDEEGNEKVFSTQGVVTEVLWGDGYDNHSFMMSDGANSLYIYAPAAGSDVVEIGDLVQISGLKVVPYYGIIESASKSATVKVLYGGQPVPEAAAYTVDEWYALNREVHDAPGQRVKLTGLLVKDGSDYKLKSETTDKAVTIYYKAYTAYEQSILDAHVGDVVEMETAIYDYHSAGYWRILPNVYDYPMTVIKAGEHPDQPDQPDQPDTPEVVTPVAQVEVGKQYKLYVNQVKASKELYFSGVMDGNFFGTTEDAAAATLVTVEAAEGGFYLSFLDAEGAKKYINIIKGSNNKNVVEIQDAPATAYVWNAEFKTMFVTIAELNNTYYLGNYNTYTTISSSATSYMTAENVDVSQFPVRFVEAEGTQPEQPSGPVDQVEAGQAYKLYVNQVKAGKELYFAGAKDGNFLATTEDAAAATLVTVEAAEGGFYLSFLDAEGAKKYINIIKGSNNKNVVEIQDAPATAYVWNAEFKTMFVTVADLNNTYYLGNYNTYTTISSSATSYMTAENVDVSQFPVRFIKASNGGTQPSEATIVDFSFTDYYNDNNCSNGTRPTELMLDEVVKYEVECTAGSYGPNSGKLYKGDAGIAEARFYKSETGKMIISVPAGVTLVKVTAVKGSSNYDAGAETELEIVDNKVIVVADGSNFNIKSLHIEYTGTPSGEGPDQPDQPDQPQEVTYITVVEAKAADNNADVNVKGLVAAIYARGFVVEDNTGAMLVYTNAAVADLAIGDYVAVAGKKSAYPSGSSAYQLGSPTYEKLTETPTYALSNAVNWSAAEVDAAWEQVVAATFNFAGPLVKMTVTMTSVGSYFNAVVDGSEQALSFSYPLDSLKAALENGKTYDVLAMPISYSNKSGSPFYFNFILLSAEEHVEAEPETLFLLDFEDHQTDGDCTDSHWAITKYSNDGWQTITSVMMRYRGKDGTRVVNMAVGYSTPYMYRYNLDAVVKNVTSASLKMGNYFSGAVACPMKIVLVLEDDSLVYLVGDASNFGELPVTTGLIALPEATFDSPLNVKAFYFVFKSPASGGGYIYVDDIQLVGIKEEEPETPVEPDPQPQVDTLPINLAFTADNCEGKSGYSQTWTGTASGHTFTVYGFNNNSFGSGWTYIKGGSTKGATTAYIASDKINAAVSKVVLNVTAYDPTNVSQVRLYMYDDPSMETAVGGVYLIPSQLEAGDWTFTISNPVSGLYYKLVIEIGTTTKNGNAITINGISFQ